MGVMYSGTEEWKEKNRQRINKLLEDFNPNKQTHPWATYIPDRKPAFKVHKNRGTALSAFQYGRPGNLYKWDFLPQSQGVIGWVELARVEDKELEKCENCGKELYTHHGTRRYRAVRYVWIGKPQWKQVQTCDACGRRLSKAPSEHRELQPRISF